MTAPEPVAAYSGGNLIFPDILDEELARITRAAGATTAMAAERSAHLLDWS